MASPIIYEPLSGSKTVRPILASDVAFGSGVILSGHIASGQIGAFHHASGSVTSGHIASGQIGQNHLASGSVTSGAIASGQIGVNHLASGSVTSGAIASGQIGQNHLSSGSVTSGAIASGQVGRFHLASGSVTSGAVASGQIGSFHLASGTSVTIAQIVLDNTFLTAVALSGGRAVSFNSSGALQHADPIDPLTMPAVGVIDTSYASGTAASFQSFGRMFNSHFNFSGGLGKQVWVVSGSTLHWLPPTGSGNVQQRMGVAVSVSGTMMNVDTESIIV